MLHKSVIGMTLLTAEKLIAEDVPIMSDMRCVRSYVFLTIPETINEFGEKGGAPRLHDASFRFTHKHQQHTATFLTRGTAFYLLFSHWYVCIFIYDRRMSFGSRISQFHVRMKKLSEHKISSTDVLVF